MLPVGGGAGAGTPGTARRMTQESQRHQGYLVTGSGHSVRRGGGERCRRGPTGGRRRERAGRGHPPADQRARVGRMLNHPPRSTRPAPPAPDHPPRSTRPGAPAPEHPPRTTRPGPPAPDHPPRSTRPGAPAPEHPPRSTRPGPPAPDHPPRSTRPGSAVTCPWAGTSSGSRIVPAGGLDVLVDMEGVVRVVAVLDLGEPVVVAAVGRFDAVLALVHQEVDVGAAG